MNMMCKWKTPYLTLYLLSLEYHENENKKKKILSYFFINSSSNMYISKQFNIHTPLWIKAEHHLLDYMILTLKLKYYCSSKTNLILPAGVGVKLCYESLYFQLHDFSILFLQKTNRFYMPYIS
jgi:hypothetical protein